MQTFAARIHINLVLIAKYNKKVGNWPTLTDRCAVRCAVRLLEHLIFNQMLINDVNCCCFWYPVKVLGIRYNLFAGIETLSLSIYEPSAMQILLWGQSPNLGRGLSYGSGVVPLESPPY